MASKQSTVDFLTDQIAGAGSIRYRKMFGEYALYCDEKVIALVCDDKLFVKPTDGGRAIVGPGNDAPPYPGAKPYLLISEDYWDDRDWMTNVIQKTASELPLPKPKKKKR
ncbi:MAG: TfoX/Sxy family protein [Candidatus Levybacteria bacterium]|nr:TfoX/Sxy family protein [Candidatus Levybacteria bacterium]